MQLLQYTVAMTTLSIGLSSIVVEAKCAQTSKKSP